jgi:hypothetical protein
MQAIFCFCYIVHNSISPPTHEGPCSVEHSVVLHKSHDPIGSAEPSEKATFLFGTDRAGHLTSCDSERITFTHTLSLSLSTRSDSKNYCIYVYAP